MNVVIKFRSRPPMTVEASCLLDALQEHRLGLRYADLQQADLEGADLQQADLEGADLRHSDLRGANLQDADLGGANLCGAALLDADLRGADLRAADLRGADLHGANLQCADLRGAGLGRTDLRAANLWCADLRDAKYGGRVLSSVRPFLILGPAGRGPRTTLAFLFSGNFEPVVQCGCFRGRLAELEERVRSVHAGSWHEDEYLEIIRHIRTIDAMNKHLECAVDSAEEALAEGRQAMPCKTKKVPGISEIAEAILAGHDAQAGEIGGAR